MRSWLFMPILLVWGAQVPLAIDIPERAFRMSGAEAQASPSTTTMQMRDEFEFQTGGDVFTPYDLVELSRPGKGVANDAGDLVLVPVSKYSLKDKNLYSVWIAPLESQTSAVEIPLPNGGDAFWLNTHTIGHVVSDDKDKTTQLFAISVEFKSVGEHESLVVGHKHKLIGTFPTGATVANFRYNPRSERLIFSAYVYPDCNLTTVKEQDEAYENRGTTAMVFDSTFVRHWDTWRGPKRSSLFSVRLVMDPDHNWIFGDEFVPLLKGTGHFVPVEPFGGTDDFDVSATHVVYTTKDPKLPPAWHTKQNIYLLKLGSNKLKELTSGSQGATHSPVFSPDGEKVAWLELDEDGYESDRAKIVIYDLDKDIRFTLTQDWDRSPDSVAFSYDGGHVLFTATDHAVIKIFALPVPATPKQSTTNPKLPDEFKEPVALTTTHASSGIQPLPQGRMVFSQSSFTSPNDVFIVRGLNTPEKPLDFQKITQFTSSEMKGKNLDAGESFYFEGAEGKSVQGWLFRPKGWKEDDAKKSWPVILFIHGGPQGAWEDQWSTRWNENVFAQQGYFVIAINPTGSSSFGQDFVDAIAKDWGGKPFIDLQKGYRYILNKYPEIDPDRAVAMGASWGGFAVNWIQGHPEYGFNFKALVCHDGVFDTHHNGFSTEELFFFNHDFGGPPWDPAAKPIIDKFNPSNYVANWSTPQLIIHGSKDFRLPDTEGIGPFHALQQRGIPSRLVIFPDENHWVLNHGNSLKWHYEILRWIDAFVGKKSS